MAQREDVFEVVTAIDGILLLGQKKQVRDTIKVNSFTLMSLSIGAIVLTNVRLYDFSPDGEKFLLIDKKVFKLMRNGDMLEVLDEAELTSMSENAHTAFQRSAITGKPGKRLVEFEFQTSDGLSVLAASLEYIGGKVMYGQSVWWWSPPAPPA